MTVYELIQKLANYSSDTIVEFNILKDFEVNGTVETDDGDITFGTVSITINERLDIEDTYFNNRGNKPNILTIYFGF